MLPLSPDLSVIVEYALQPNETNRNKQIGKIKIVNMIWYSLSLFWFVIRCRSKVAYNGLRLCDVAAF